MPLSIKTHSIWLWFLALSAIIVLLLIIFKLDPTTNRLNRLAFFIDFAVFVYALTALMGFYSRKSIGQREYLRHYLKISLRQGLWFSVLISVSLLLKSMKLFTVLNMSFLIIALVFLESFFLAKSQRNQS